MFDFRQCDPQQLCRYKINVLRCVGLLIHFAFPRFAESRQDEDGQEGREAHYREVLSASHFGFPYEQEDMRGNRYYPQQILAQQDRGVSEQQCLNNVNFSKLILFRQLTYDSSILLITFCNGNGNTNVQIYLKID